MDKVKYAESRKFGEMGGVEKIVYTVKLSIFFCTFGFAFPLILNQY